MIKKIILSIFLCFFIISAGYCKTPLDSIKEPTNNIISILKAQEYKKLTPELKEKQWNEIWAVVESSFDFDIIARLGVGKYWNSFSDTQKKEFSDLFAKLLANTYINKVQENFKNQQVNYIKEKISGKRAEVLVHVALENKPVPIIYRMINKDQWLIYDVKVEGMSMIKNYRSQFDEFLFKNSPEDLIKALNKKNESLKKERMQIN